MKNKRKIITIILIVCLLTMLFSVNLAFANTKTYDNSEFIVGDELLNLSNCAASEETGECECAYVMVNDTDEYENTSFEMVEQEGQVYSMESRALAFAIPVWMGLSESAVAALVALAKAAGITVLTTSMFVVVEELIDKINDSSTLYYEAYVDTNLQKVLVGDEISRGEAVIIIAYNNVNKAVFCKNRSVAYNLASRLGGVKREDNASCVHAGQWPHFHCNDFPTAHIFYPN